MEVNKQMLEALETLIEAKDLKESEGKTLDYLIKRREGWDKARHAVKCAKGIVSDI